MGERRPAFRGQRLTEDQSPAFAFQCSGLLERIA